MKVQRANGDVNAVLFISKMSLTKSGKSLVSDNGNAEFPDFPDIYAVVVEGIQDRQRLERAVRAALARDRNTFYFDG
jgi:hypothetical protein